MRIELWLTCLLLSIGLATCQEDMEGGSPPFIEFNSTDTEDVPPDYLPVNDTSGNDTTIDDVEGTNDTITVNEPIAPGNDTEGSSETEETSTTTMTTAKGNVSMESEAPPESVSTEATATMSATTMTENVSTTAEATSEGSSTEPATTTASTTTKENVPTTAESSENPISPGNESEESPNTEGTSTVTVTTTTAKVSKESEATEDSVSTEATATTSATTTTENVSTTAEAISVGTTKKTRTRRPRTTKHTRRPRRKEDGKYGTVIDRNGCKHKVLETKGIMLTATCNGRCGKVTRQIHDGTPCLRSLRRSGRLNKREKRRCLLGTCHDGRCVRPYGRAVTCKAPRDTVHYYEDNNYYNDEYGTESYYDYDGRYGDDYTSYNDRDNDDIYSSGSYGNVYAE